MASSIHRKPTTGGTAFTEAKTVAVNAEAYAPGGITVKVPAGTYDNNTPNLIVPSSKLPDAVLATLDSDITAPNIMDGISIFGVIGTGVSSSNSASTSASASASPSLSTSNSLSLSSSNSLSLSTSSSVSASNSVSLSNSTSASASVEAAMPSGLVGYWAMNNNWTDAANANNGTAAGNAAFSTSAKVGSHAGSFDGDDTTLVTGADTALPSAAAARSIALWAKPASLKDYQAFFFYGSTGDVGQAFLISTKNSADNNKLVVGRYGGNSGISTGTITAAAWNHIVVTMDADGNVAFYINGAAAGTTTLTGHSTVLGSYKIGDGWNASDNLNGLIDEVRVYDKVLSPAEVAAIYNYPL